MIGTGIVTKVKKLLDGLWWQLPTGVRLRLELRKRKRRHGRLWATIRSAQAAAKDSGRNPKEVEDDYEFERRDSSDDIFEVEDALLLLKAARHGIALDDFGYERYAWGDGESPWQRGLMGQPKLDLEARQKIETELRKRQPEIRRELRENIQMWTGLIGALTGLAAVLLNGCPGD